MISETQIEDYARDGVVCVKGAFGDWVDRLSAGLARNMATPSPRARVWNKDDAGRTCFYDSQVWRDVPEYEAFVRESNCGELAGRLMGSRSSTFFFDAIFVRTPGMQFSTPFHQDEPYWSVEGFDTCSVWMPLVEVEAKSSLEFVRGSHLWGQKYKQTNFGELTGDARDQVAFSEDDTVPFPDVDTNREGYEIISWEMSPGDAVFFNGRVIHGGGGKLRADRDLKVFDTQWLGDDVRVRFREEGMDPDHSGVMREHGLSDGALLNAGRGGELYPRVWQA